MIEIMIINEYINRNYTKYYIEKHIELIREEISDARSTITTTRP